MKHERSSDLFGSDDSYAIFWGERQDELVAQLNSHIEMLDKHQLFTWESRHSDFSKKEKTFKLGFYSDWTMPKMALPRYTGQKNVNFWCYMGVDMFTEFLKISEKFILDAEQTVLTQARFDPTWVLDIRSDGMHATQSFCFITVSLTSQEKFPVK